MSATRLLARDHADRLAGHHGAGLHVAVDDGAAQGAGPEMLVFELGRLASSPRRPGNRRKASAWASRKRRVPSLTRPRTGNHGEAGVELDGGQRVACVGPDEGALEVRRARCFRSRPRNACRAARRMLPSPGRTGSPRRVPGRLPRRPVPRLDRCGSISCASTVSDTGPIWPAGFRTLDHQRIGAGFGQANRFASTSAGAKQMSFAPPSLTARTAGPGRDAAGQHDMRDTGVAADTRTSASSSRVHGDQVHPERRVRQRLGGGDLLRRAAPVPSQPQAITPNPPALEMAATRVRSLTQLIAPPMMAVRVPRNAVPRDQSRSSFGSAASGGRGLPVRPWGSGCQASRPYAVWSARTASSV